jgi:hypothetical protein
MKLCIAVPCYSGQMSFQFVNSLLQTYKEFLRIGIPIDFKVAPGLCYADLARNILVDAFLKSDATDLLFIDDDIGFKPEAVLRIINCKEEIVGGIYPYKNEVESYPVNPVTDNKGNYIVNENGLIEVYGLPAGFLRIKRGVLEDYIHAHPETKCITSDHAGNVMHSFHNIFRCRQDAQGWYGEDMEFVHIMNNFGVKVWAMPDIDFVHVGNRTYRGNFQNFAIRQATHVNS